METMKLNGNRFQKEEHVFVEGKGCFYPTKDNAWELSPINGNSTGIYLDSVEFEGATWYRYGESNVWD